MKKTLLTPVVCLVATLSLACGSSTGLPPASIENVVDTVTLFALEATPLERPGAINLVSGETVRTDRTDDFDISFTLDSTATLWPTLPVGFEARSGIQQSSESFDQIIVAPDQDYTTEEPVPIAVGDVLVMHSRPTPCFGSTLVIYGKVEVIAIDATAGTLDLKILINLNCGYRNLQPGIPDA